MSAARSRRGLTLLEVLISGVLLCIVMVPLSALMRTGTHGIETTDRQRDARFLVDRLLERIEATDFVVLWKNYGWGFGPECPACPDSGEAMRDGVFVPGRNPLALDADLLARLSAGEWKATLQFRFLTKDELQQESRVKSRTGILHLQAGAFRLRVQGGGVDEDVRQALFCPMILGRPGLQLQQCPAVNPALRDGLFASYP